MSAGGELVKTVGQIAFEALARHIGSPNTWDQVWPRKREEYEIMGNAVVRERDEEIERLKQLGLDGIDREETLKGTITELREALEKIGTKFIHLIQDECSCFRDPDSPCDYCHEANEIGQLLDGSLRSTEVKREES